MKYQHQLIVALVALVSSTHGFSTLQAASRSVRCGRGVGRIRMGDWTPPPISWSPCKVTKNAPAAAGLKKISVDAGEVASQFVTPGQYVQVKTPGAELGSPWANIYAISSAPAGEAELEFLIKEAESAAFFTEAEEGAELEISGVQGKGFNTDILEDSAITAVDLLATGSGISPIRSVIESGALEGKKCRLFYGVRTPEHVAFAEAMEGWEGVETIVCVSQPDATEWQGETGYVQDVLKQRGIADPAATAVLLCGQKEMGIACKEYLAEAGVQHILMNF